MKINKMIGTLVAVALVSGAMLIFVAWKNSGDSSHSSLFVNQPLGVSLLSNREVAGLQFAYFTLSNRTGRPVRYLRDSKADEPAYSLIERSAPDPSTGIITVTNHNQERFRYVVPADLPPHSSLPFRVRYPSEVTNPLLRVSYMPNRTGFQSLVYNLTQRAFGKAPLPTNAYDYIELTHPFR